MSNIARPWPLLRYALPGLPLAALGLPFYIYVPLWLSEQAGYGYALVGLLFFVARLSDVVTDLPVGAWVDRHGCGRGFWFSAWALTAVAAVALFGFPHPWPAPLLLAVLVLLMLGWTGINVPWLALPVHLASDAADRLRYNSAREAMLLFGTLLALLTPGLLSPQLLRWVLLPMLVFLLVAVMLQGSHRGLLSTAADRRGLWALLTESRVRGLAFPWFVNMLANAIPGTILVLFMREVIVAEEAVPLALLVYFLSGLLGVPLWYLVARRLGNLLSWRIGLCISALLFSLAALLGEGDLYWFLAICVGTGLTLGADQAIPTAMQTGLAQTLAEERESVIGARLFALWSMLSKAAMGLAVGVSYLWLGSQASENVPPDWAISFAYVLAPVVLKLVVFYLLGRQSLRWLAREVERHAQT